MCSRYIAKQIRYFIWWIYVKFYINSDSLLFNYPEPYHFNLIIKVGSTNCPLSQTVVVKSLAPMTRYIRLPFQSPPFGIMISWAYQPTWKSLHPMPDSGDAHENGTVIVSTKTESITVSSQPCISPTSRESGAKFHSPFRLIQRSRSKSGRGCSDKGMSAV